MSDTLPTDTIEVPSIYLRGTASPDLPHMEPMEGSAGNIKVPAIYNPTGGAPAAKPPETPPQQGIMGRSWQSLIPGPLRAVLPAGEAVSKYMAGEGRTEFPDQQNLFESMAVPNSARALPLTVAYLLNARPDQLKYLAQDAFPGSTLSVDNKNNPMITLKDGRKFYVSKPGISLQDVVGFSGEAGLQVLAALATRGILPKSMNAPGAMKTLAISGAQGLASMLTKAGEGEAIRQMGGKTGADFIELGLAGVGGFAGAGTSRIWQELVAKSEGKGALLFHFLGAPDDAPITPSMVTKSGAQLLDGVIDPTRLTVGQARKMQETLGSVVRQASDQEGRTAVRNTVQSARENVPMTPGQIVGNREQLGRETALRFGPGEQIMRTFDAGQREALTAAAGNRLPGSGSPLAVTTRSPAGPWQPPPLPARPPNAPPPTRLELADALENQLQRRATQLADNEAQAWRGLETATPLGERMTPGGLRFDAELADRYNGIRFGQMQEETPLSTFSAAQEARTQINRALFRTEGEGDAAKVVPNSIDLGKYRQLRQTLGRLTDSTDNQQEKRIIIRMKEALDDATDQTVAAGMISGDPARLGQLRDAMKASRAEFAFWEPKNPVAAKFMGDLQDGRLTGEQIYRALFGAGRLNAGGPANQIMDHLERQFGKNSELWRDVQRAAVRSTIFGDSADAFNPQRMIAEINKALEGRGEGVLRRLDIDPGQLRELQRLAETINQSAPRNKSGTAGEWFERFRLLAKRIPFLEKMVDDNATIMSQARRVTGSGAGARLQASDFGPNAADLPPGLLAPAVGAEALPPTVRERGR